MLDDNKMTITDDDGNEHEVEILLTFENADKTKNYVLFTIPDDSEGNVYAYSFGEDGEMVEVEDEEEWQMCQEVLGAFLEEEES
ncbi:MAG: DUF1292 domain-containing protein [Erysipelotrichaceae bacterium]|nr:DUF1292 domain-containing protein [Erysipelotrichaceae bacterium]MDY6035097.1 DUF1292 domain-containing protein [Bulleidia sp.]